MTDAKHEAPAEGAGEQWLWRIPGRGWVLVNEEAEVVREARVGSEWVETEVIALSDLRARSSAPEAREGEAVAGAKALAFFKWARDIFWNDGGYEIGGGDFQDAAERLGLIVKVPFDPERHADNGYGLEAGDDWYETEPAVQLALSTLDALKGDAKS